MAARSGWPEAAGDFAFRLGRGLAVRERDAGISTADDITKDPTLALGGDAGKKSVVTLLGRGVALVTSAASTSGSCFTTPTR